MRPTITQTAVFINLSESAASEHLMQGSDPSKTHAVVCTKKLMMKDDATVAQKLNKKWKSDTDVFHYRRSDIEATAEQMETKVRPCSLDEVTRSIQTCGGEICLLEAWVMLELCIQADDSPDLSVFQLHIPWAPG